MNTYNRNGQSGWFSSLFGSSKEDNNNNNSEKNSGLFGSWFGSNKQNNLNQYQQTQNQGWPNPQDENPRFGGSRRKKTISRIDFSKIKWGSFTKKYNSYIKRHPHKKTNIPDLKHFAQYVNKNPKKFNKKTHKRALFYKNIILRKRK